jgi:CRP-like cAMP-binding protein
MKAFFVIFKNSFQMIFAAHVLGCIFYYLIANDSAEEINWMTSYDPTLVLEDTPAFERYVVSFYWALVTISTVGYGDILPTNHTERIFNICALLIGGLCFAFCLGMLQTLIGRGGGTDLIFEQKITSVKQYLSFRVSNPTFVRKVLRWYGNSWRKSGLLYSELDLLQEMPADLSNGIYKMIAGQVKKEIPLLQGLDDHTIGYIFSRLKSHSFDTDDVIYEQREVGSTMYCITAGEVEIDAMKARVIEGHTFALPPEDTCWKQFVESPGSKVLAGLPGTTIQAGSGNFLGECSLFWDICKYRSESVKATMATTCFTLDRSTLLELGETVPEFVAKLRELCLLRAQYLGVSPHPQSHLHSHLYSKYTRGLTLENFYRYKQCAIRAHERSAEEQPQGTNSQKCSPQCVSQKT